MGERQDVWGLHEREGLWNQTILAYALAFGKLQQNDATKPQSWSLDFQAAVHDVNEAAPPPGDLIAECQHGTWFFLPWHRLYLSMYEKVIRAILADLASPAIEEATVENWSLPYWNYERESARTLPPAFREAQLPDGLGANPLAKARRFEWVQDGSIPLDEDQVQPSGWWNEPLFSTPVRADSFGGQVTGWNHRPSAATSPGALEITPHGSVHNYVGRDMMGFATAGRDPIFWLHHCNIDRIWEVWKKNKTPTPPAPSGGQWGTLEFAFLDETGTETKDVAANLVSTTALGYTYEFTGKPDIPERFRTRGALMGPHEDELATRSLPPRHLGGSSTDVTLALAPTTVDITLEQDDEVHTRADRPTEARVQLHLRNLTMDGEPTVSYSVYLEGVDDPSKLAYVGQVPLFGLVESMDDDAEHQLEYTYDATDAVNELRGEDEWSWDRAKVRIQPSNAEVAARVTDPAELVIGSVSFSFQ